MDKVKIGQFIANCRKDKKLTQEQLAEKLNISKNAVSKWERGICLMDMSLLKPLSEVLGVSVNDILSGEKIPEDKIKDKSEEVRRKNAMKDEKSKITAIAIEKMIDFYQGNLRDIEHFLKVWAYAKTIGEQESVDENTQGILELAAVVHDISCPLCREKYGNTNGKNQELESEPLVKEFFEGMPVSEQKVERIIWLVTHHHTYTNIDGIDYQVLIEADFLVNASESNFSKVSIENAKSRIFKTAAGCRLLESIFLREE